MLLRSSFGLKENILHRLLGISSQYHHLLELEHGATADDLQTHRG